MSRYHLVGEYVIENRKGFPVHRKIDVHCNTNLDLQTKASIFLEKYDYRDCHSLEFHVVELKKSV